MIEQAPFIVGAVVLVTASGYCSASESAFFSLSVLQVKSFEKDKSPIKRLVANLLKHPKDLLVTIFTLNTLVNILLQNVVSDMFGDSGGWLGKVALPLFLTLIFGEILPKYLGLQNNAAFSCFSASSISFAQKALKPILKAVLTITIPLSRAMFFYLKKAPDISPEELEHALRTSRKHGVLDEEELELVLGYLQLQTQAVKDIMWPREDILFYDFHEPLSKLTYLFADKECSRLPVCDQAIDNVLGVITAKDFLIHKDRLVEGKDVLNLLKKPFYIPETASARMLLKRFKEKQEVLALVVNEYGAVSGLIAEEDLAEVVVGEISDLRDQKQLYTLSGEDEIIVSGKMELGEFNRVFKADLKSPSHMVTIGGWLIEMLGEIPKPGKKIATDYLLFHVLSATPSRIKRIYVRKLLSKKDS